MATIRQLIADGEAALSDSDSARLDAEILLATSIKQSRTWLYTWPDHIPTLPEQHLYLELIRRRQTGEPVAYLCGRREFWGLSLKVDHNVLIPRPETELLVETVLARLDKKLEATVADLGTGSGAIALALGSEKPAWKIVATDQSEGALEVARENARALNVPNVVFRAGEWTQALDKTHFDVIVSNPPYIEEGDCHLVEGDVRFEPVSALVSGKDGLEDIRQIAGTCREFLQLGGWLMLEHGYNQGESVRQIMTVEGYTDIETLEDLAGHDRVTLGRNFPDILE
jgi:release factor glutamine methyltransferase